MRSVKISWIYMVYIGIAVWTLFPIVSVILAAIPASLLGCSVDEGSIHVCKVLGVDIGPVLYSLGVMGWFMLITIPTGVVATVLFSIVIGVLHLTKTPRK